jgi:hypothetical protein
LSVQGQQEKLNQSSVQVFLTSDFGLWTSDFFFTFAREVRCARFVRLNGGMASGYGYGRFYAMVF